MVEVTNTFSAQFKQMDDVSSSTAELSVLQLEQLQQAAAALYKLSASAASVANTSDDTATHTKEH
ncbi:MAG: hypothetical protein HWE26_19335 [Alteromonadaceae bacterium]|nr:hypothetical protein [Alteromonadaceae bacterium]